MVSFSFIMYFLQCLHIIDLKTDGPIDSNFDLMYCKDWLRFCDESGIFVNVTCVFVR